MNRRPGFPDTAMTKESPMRALCNVLLITLLLSLTGCADLDIPNPFETKTSDGSEIYFDQFPDVPLPRDMSVDVSRSLISVAQDGTKTGLVTVEGRVDKPSLANAMISNMHRQGWNLRGAVIGTKTIHLYEKGERYAVIYYYDQTTTAAMEIWVMTRLADGVLPTIGGSTTGAGGLGSAGGSSPPSFYLTPDANASGSSAGGVHQQGLSQ